VATSLRSLLDALDEEVARAESVPNNEAGAARALGPLGRTLQRLANDGLSDEIGGYRERFVQELGTACVVASNPSDAGEDRLPLLSGVLADTTEILRFELGGASRWAAAVEMATIARRLGEVASNADAPKLPSSALEHVRRAGILVERTGAIEPPSASDARPLDRAIPSPLSQPPQQPADRITEAMAGLVHYTRPGAQLAVAEVLAVGLAAETLCVSAATLHSPNHPQFEAMTSAGQAWRRVGVALQPFNDGSRHRHDDLSTAVGWAIQLHETLRQTNVTGVQIAHDGGPLNGKGDIRDGVAACVAQLPELGANLCELIQGWPRGGRVLAYAQQLPPREDRIREHLDGRKATGLIHVDTADLRPAVEAVRSAVAESVPRPDLAANKEVASMGRAADDRPAISRQRLSDWRSPDHEQPAGAPPADQRLPAASQPVEPGHRR